MGKLHVEIYGGRGGGASAGEVATRTPHRPTPHVHVCALSLCMYLQRYRKTRSLILRCIFVSFQSQCTSRRAKQKWRERSKTRTAREATESLRARYAIVSSQARSGLLGKKRSRNCSKSVAARPLSPCCSTTRPTTVASRPQSSKCCARPS